MLHRLAVNLKMEALLFQLSVFNLFNKILSDPAAAAYTVQTRQPSVWSGQLLASCSQLQIRRSQPVFSSSQELVTFAKYVVNRFFGLAAQNNKAYVELLFWKNVGAVREMTEGYDKDGLVLSLFCVSLDSVYRFITQQLFAS